MKGFTLIELLVVIAIVGILMAIGITEFQVYKTESYNAVALADLKNSQVAQEAAYLDEGAYQPCGSPAECETALPGFKASRDGSGQYASVIFQHVPLGEHSYSADSRHTLGNITYHYETGAGLVERQ